MSCGGENTNLDDALPGLGAHPPREISESPSIHLVNARVNQELIRLVGHSVVVQRVEQSVSGSGTGLKM